jgi:hypothetical protein
MLPVGFMVVKDCNPASYIKILPLRDVIKAWS